MSNKIYASSPSILKRLHASYLVFVYMYMVIDSWFNASARGCV